MNKEHHTIGRYPVRMQDCDPTGRIHLHRLFDFAQDADDQNCHLFDIRSDALKNRGYCWILLSYASSFTKELPKGEDSLIVDSWTRGTKGVRFYRENHYYKNTMDEAHYIGCASSEWIICTRGEHRPLRPSEIVDTEAFNERSDPQIALYDKMPRLKRDDSIWDNERTFAHKVSLSDLDTNTHLHSANYLRLAIDQLGRHLQVDPQKNALVVDAIQIQYMQELRYGETLLIASKKLDGFDRHFLVEGKAEGSDSPSFLARIEGGIVAINA